MKVTILEIENGESRVFATLTLNKYMTREKVLNIVNERNRKFGTDKRSYMLSR